MLGRMHDEQGMHYKDVMKGIQCTEARDRRRVI
jgi:hypothetical protein